MNKRDKYIKQINHSLAVLRVEIKQLNLINMTDYNIVAEDFYKDLLTFYGYNLKNLNEVKKNADSIDLVDTENKIAIQVTSRNDTKKIHDTIEGFYKNSDYDGYNQLIMLLIGKDKLEYAKTDFTKGGLFSFNKETDIVDINDIMNKFKGYKAEQLEPIVDFLENEIDIKINIKKTKSNEVITIIKMIEFLSNDENYIKTVVIEIIDPEKKRMRFVNYFDFLMEKYKELYPIYAETLVEAKKASSIDGVRAEKTKVYLRDLSNKFLVKNLNNSQDALYDLVSYFEKEISSSNLQYDVSAIKFYLLDELINCNVFPNPNE